MTFASIRGAEIFYTDEGDSDIPLIFIHGWTCDSTDWIWQLPFFRQNHRVIAFDARGHGHSTGTVTDYTPESDAKDVLSLMDHLEIKKAILVGHSLGGVVASLLSGLAPDRVEGVVAIDPPYGFDEESAARNRGLLAALSQGPAGDVAGNFFAVLEGQDTPRHLIEWHRRRAMGTPADVVVETFRGTHTVDSIVNLPAAANLVTSRVAPSLVFHAQPAVLEWESTLVAGPKDQLVLVENSGHWIHQEHPDFVNNEVQKWISKL